MKLIALDVGTKRIGIAKADAKVRIAVPHGTVKVDGSELMQIASFARIYGTSYFVIGLPRNSKGEETAQSRYVRKFAAALKKMLPDAKIRFQDESLTSVEARKRLDARKKNYAKGDVDAEAATIILQDFLESIAPPASATRRDHPARKKTKSSESHRVRNVILSLIALLIFIAAGGYIFYRVQSLPVAQNVDCSNPQSSEACKTVDFTIANGTTVQEVAQNLKDARLIRSPLAFQVSYQLHHAKEPIKTGTFALNQTMSLDEILDKLINGDDNVFRLTILPGNTLNEVKQKISEQGYSANEIEAAFTKQYNHPVLEGKPTEASLEGYLYGETYEFFRGDSVEKIITTMLDQLHKTVIEKHLVEAFRAHNLDLYQGLTLASIVQKEAKADQDQAIVAQIFYKRLETGTPLGSDITIQYALDLVDPQRTTYKDNAAALQVDSPYNTRTHQGLPPGPVCNPGLSALLAVAQPADTAYFYFLTGDDGLMYYSDTEAGHQQNISEHCRELCRTAL